MNGAPMISKNRQKDMIFHNLYHKTKSHGGANHTYDDVLEQQPILAIGKAT